MRAKHIVIEKKDGENNSSILRRFSRKVRESRIIQTVKGERYYSRKPSKLTQKESALKKLERRRTIEKLRKLGKVA